MNIVLFDGKYRNNLLPLTFTRPVADLRVGILTISEKWKKLFPESEISYLTESYLSKKYPTKETDDTFFIAGNVCGNRALADEIGILNIGECLYCQGELIALRGKKSDFLHVEDLKVRESVFSPIQIRFLYDIFLNNDQAINDDYKLLIAGKQSQTLSSTVTVVGNPIRPDGLPAVFVEYGATVECAVLNVQNGPIYIGRDAQVMEGSCIRAPFAACDHAVVNMGAKIYGATTLGPYCKVGGELNNVVMQGYSNKAHDGFLGNAVIGEWCNLGAGTTASNLKNDYSEIKMWNYAEERFTRTGLQFCGLIMGDHSKIGINSMLNTATVMGVAVNFFGSGFPKTFIPSFAKGSVAGFSLHELNQFYSMAEAVMNRRGKALTEVDREIYATIFDITAKYWRIRS